MPLQNGDTFAGYTIVRTLGAGGMGGVYLFRIKFALCPTAIGFGVIRRHCCGLFINGISQQVRKQAAQPNPQILPVCRPVGPGVPGEHMSTSNLDPVIVARGQKTCRVWAFVRTTGGSAVDGSSGEVERLRSDVGNSAGCDDRAKEFEHFGAGRCQGESENVLVAAQRMMARQPGDIGRVVKQS